MKRREFITLLGGATVAPWPMAARGQQAANVRRVALLMPYPPTDAVFQDRVRVLRDELARLGWTRGRNIQFDERWTGDNMDLIRSHAANIVELKPDVIVASGGRVVPIVLELTRTIPIINPNAGDPIGNERVETIARPGGNFTGFSFWELSVLGKILETLKQIAPSTLRAALIFNPDNPGTARVVASFKAFAGPLVIEPLILPIHRLADIERAFEHYVGAKDVGLVFPPDLTINALRVPVTALVARHGLPAIYSERDLVQSGGLMSYDTDRLELYRRSASYVDRILRGEKPGDLPFQQPTKYQLTINLKTAKALGLTVPNTLLSTADEVIE